MLADIVGYSTLMEREESRTFARLHSLREQVVNPKVAEFGGRVIKTTGDGFLAEFPSPTAALGCGITIQRVNFAQESTRDEAERFHLRIGSTCRSTHSRTPKTPIWRASGGNSERTTRASMGS
jgi:adenylate cyclase